MLSENELGQYIDQRLTRSAFRLELLDLYDSVGERDYFTRYLKGEPVATLAQGRGWLKQLRAEADAGIHNQRVHVLRTPLTDYLRFECAWGYAYNSQAGEDILILDLAERTLPAGLTDHDFWLIDNQHAIVMHYSDDGQFVGAEPASSEQVCIYQKAREAAVAAAQPFASWWHAHAEEHRTA
jgi:hypothetical protein